VNARSRRDLAVVVAIALALRVALAFVAHLFPPAGDGTYYDIVARRIAGGHGYTWLWPDGAVTYAAHYPVGFPAMVGAAYAVFGVKPAVLVCLNAALGAAGSGAAYELVRRRATPTRALVGGLLVAAHPALVPYTLAAMTEGATTALVLLAGALAEAARSAERRRIALSLGAFAVIGVATLVRPQSLVLAPVLGALAWDRSLRARALGAALATACALLVCAPWTARNCVRMNQCALVSVNGGWNLLIGAQSESGSWAPVDVPEACKTVWDEAGKDACFGVAARRIIRDDPGRWLARVPSKLATTFDYFGAAPWYLNASNPQVFPERAKIALGTVETAVSRGLLVAALVGLGWGAWRRPTRRARVIGWTALACAPAALLRHAWPAYLAFALLCVASTRWSRRPPVLPAFAGAVVLATAALHATFFGAGRYGLVVAPFVALLAACPRVASEPDE